MAQKRVYEQHESIVPLGARMNSTQSSLETSWQLSFRGCCHEIGKGMYWRNGQFYGNYCIQHGRDRVLKEQLLDAPDLRRLCPMGCDVAQMQYSGNFLHHFGVL